MPNYKLVDSVQLERDLTTVADAIRGKTGSSDALVFPDGYVGAVDGLGAPDDFENGYADALSKRTDLVITENGEYTPEGESTGFKSVAVSVVDKSTDQIIDGSITEITSNVETVKESAFSGCKSLVSVNLPNAKNIGSNAFKSCSKLAAINLPSVERIEAAAFFSCTFQEIVITSTSIVTLNDNSHFPVSLVAADFHCACVFKGLPFQNSYVLKTLILRNGALSTTAKSTIFDKCYRFTGAYHKTYNPESLKDGYIYVPRSLVEEYKAATNWTVYADRFRALEDYTVDGTTTGELDESKI